VLALLGCAGFTLYVLLIYPAMLALWARLRTKPVLAQAEGGSGERSVTVLLPVRNGEQWIRPKLENLLALDYPRDLVEIIVISDGSTDGTEEVAAGYPVRMIRIESGGKAAALNRGLEEAHGEILFFTDVRQELDQVSLRHLVKCFDDPRVGVATGELIIRAGATQEEANVGLYWKYEKWIRRRLSRIDSVLGATGCIYAMRRLLARPMPAGTILDDVYLPMLAFRAGYRIVMEERARAYDEPTSLETEFRRKVRTQAGVYQLIRQLPWLLGTGNRMWLHFVSYKLGRLLLPFALIGLAVSSLWLPEPVRVTALAAQGALYSLAILNRWIPQTSGLKRLSAPASAFAVLMGAALCAVSIFFVAPQRLWSPGRLRSQ
jgi:cellulose synthase/poly-beta-1,6-N-acetylglucosamine synthase-like glycosyltransferase